MSYEPKGISPESAVKTIPDSKRRHMIREQLYHQEAIDRTAWEMPPIEPGDNSSSYADMLLDPMVHYGVSLIKESVLAQGYHIEQSDVGTGASPGRGSAAMAIEIERNLADVDIEAALEDGLSAIWRGFWAHEITWQYSDRKFKLVSLAAIDPEQVTLELNDHMRVTAVTSKPIGHDPQRTAADKLWFHVHKPSRTRPAGESILEPAYRAWTSKNRLLQFWGLSIQRFGMTALKVTLPANTPPDKQTQILATLYQGRLDGIYLIPEDVFVEALNPTQWANLTFEQSISYQDAEIIKAITLLNSPGGSATGRTYVTGQGIDAEQRATAYRLQRISRALCHSFTAQVIQPLCLANWGAKPEQCPRLVLAPPDPARIVAMAPALAQLVGAGIMDTDIAADQMGLPEPKGLPKPTSKTTLGIPTTGNVAPGSTK
jgi:phage gp29-like protein